MAKADIYNLKNEVVGSVDLPKGIFEVEWKPKLVHQVLVAQDANARSPWAHAKIRGEVSGTGKRPWRQKGSGRSRHGSRRSPLWKGGGVTHGPRNERDYSQKVNEKMKRTALASVLSHKLATQDIKIIENFDLKTSKTKDFFAAVRPMVGITGRAKKIDTLFVAQPHNTSISRAARNIPKSKVLTAESLNIHDLLNYKNLFLEAATISEIAKKFSSHKVA